MRQRGLEWKVDRLQWVNLRQGGSNLRVIGADSAVRRALKPWVSVQRARIKWDVSAPPAQRPKPLPTAARKKVKIASWNVNSLQSKRWEIRDSVSSMKLSVCALQETMTKDGDWPFSIPGFNVYQVNSDKDVPGARGLALAVSKHLPSHLVESNSHYQVARVNVSSQVWFFLNVYVAHDVATKRRVLANLKQRVQRLQNHDPECRFVILGDLNCQKSRAQTIFPRNYGVGLVRVSGSDKTFHRSGRWSGIDHILASTSALPLLKKAKVKRKYEASDHFPIVSTMRLRYQPRQVQLDQKKIDRIGVYAKANQIVNDDLWERWWNTYQETPPDNEELSGKEWLENAAERWDKTSWKVAERVGALSVPCPPKFKKISRQTKKAVTEKRQAWKAYLEGNPDRQADLLRAYKEKRKLAKKALLEYAKQTWVRSLIQGTQSLREGAARKFFRWVDKIIKYRGRQDLSVNPIADDHGQLQFDPPKIAELWADHYEALFSGTAENNKGMEYWERNGGLTQQGPLQGVDDDITWAEVLATLRDAKNYKAPGPSGLPAEWFKILSEEPDNEENMPDAPNSPMARILHLILTSMWQHSHVPNRWGVAELISIGKKGDLSLRTNYRGISLIETIVKIAVRLIARRISRRLEEEKRLATEQAGFRDLEECMGQTVTLLETLHRRQVQKRGTILLFIDFKKAYDMVDHDALLYKLKCVGVTERALEFLRALYSSSSTRIRVGQTRSRIIQLRRGCRQGCPGSPLFFDVFINDLAAELQETGVVVPGVDQVLGSLLFADDLIVLCDSVNSLRRACQIITAWSMKWGMEIGNDKCGLMVVNSADLKMEVVRNHQECRLLDKEIPWAESYQYLGVTVSEESLPAIPDHIRDRLTLYNARWQRLTPFLRSHSIPICSRMRIFKTICLPVLRWGSEAMGPSKASLTELAGAYHQSLKGMVGSRSKNTIYAMLTVRRELGVPSFQEIVMVSRARALWKYPSLNTWAAVLLQNSFASSRSGWIKASKEWLKKYPKVNCAQDSLATAKEKIRDYFRASEEASSEGKTRSFQRYRESEFEDTRLYLKSALAYPKWSRGVTWLLRARVNGIWSTKRAAKLNLIDAEWATACPACQEHIDIDELGHIMLFCQKYVVQRRILGLALRAVLDAALDPNQKTILLLGGRVNDGAEGPIPHPWSDRQWAGLDGETVGETGEPGFIPVARFLQEVMPKHMASLWALRRQ